MAIYLNLLGKVNLMKIYLLSLISLLSISSAVKAQTVEYYTQDIYNAQPQIIYEDVAPGYQYKPQLPASAVEQIRQKDRVYCGSNLRVKSFAQIKEKRWSGIDADLCRVFAQAILGDSRKIVMVNVAANHVADALNQGKIDIMLSGSPRAAQMEISHQALSVGPIYYDYQKILVADEKVENLLNYKDKKACLVKNSDDYKNFDDYNTQQELGITYLSFETMQKAQEAFLLKRCQILTGSGLELSGLLQNMPNRKAAILPQSIASRPVYAFVQKDNHEMQLLAKWILNAMFLAEQYNIKKQNLEYFATNDNPEIRNLLGDNPELWNMLELDPQWVRKAVEVLGNYGDIYERNLGEDSNYVLPRTSGKLVKDGGTIWPIPFM